MTPDDAKRTHNISDLYEGAEMCALLVEIPMEMYRISKTAYHEGLKRKAHILTEAEWFGGLLCGGIYACAQGSFPKSSGNYNEMQSDLIKQLKCQIDECAKKIAYAMKDRSISHTNMLDNLDGQMETLMKVQSMIAGYGRL